MAVAGETLDGEVLDEAGRFARRRVGDRPSEGEVGVVAVDAEPPEGGGIEPGGVDVVAEDQGGRVAGGRVEVGGGGHASAGDGGVVEGLGLDPVGVRVFGVPGADTGVDRVEAPGTGELDAGVVGAEADVVVGVDEAGQDEPSAGVEELGAGPGPGLGSGVGTDPDDAPGADGEGLGLGEGRVDGVDPGPGEDQIGGSGGGAVHAGWLRDVRTRESGGEGAGR